VTGVGLPIGALARRVGGYVWIEERLFEHLGELARHEADPAAKVALDGHARQHAEHARWWRARLPVLAGVEHDDLVVAPGGLPAPAGDAAATVGATLSPLLARYREHLAEVSPVADGPVSRVLRAVIADLEAEIAVLGARAGA
jgi:hypothetical protein